MGKITENMKMVYTALKEMNGTGFAKEVLRHLEAKGIKDKTFNSVNATLAALATKGYVSKGKDMFEDKVYVKYTILKDMEDASAQESVKDATNVDNAGDTQDTPEQ